MRALLLFLTALPSFATDYVTIRSGNWNDGEPGSTPWATGTCTARTEAPNVIPGDGDRVTICNANEIVIPAGYNAVIGNGATPATLGLRTNSTGGTGALTVHGTLTVRANVQLGNATWTFEPGSSLIFDNSAIVIWRTSDLSNRTDSKLLFNGSPSNHVTVTSIGAANGRFSNTSNVGGGMMEAYYTDFSKIGDASTIGFNYLPGNVAKYIWENVTCNECGPHDGGIFTGSFVFRMKRVKFTNSLGGYSADVSGLNTPIAADGERLIEDSYFDKRFGGNPAGSLTDVTFRNVVFGSGWTGFLSGRWALMENIVNINAGGGGGSSPLLGPISGCYYLKDANNGAGMIANPHYLGYTGGVTDVFINGCIFESSNSDGQGDTVLVQGNPSAPVTLALSNNIILSDAATGNTSGTCITFFGGTFVNLKASYENNVCFVGNQGFHVAENGNGMTGSITSFRRNIHWDDNAVPRGWKVRSLIGPGAATDILLPENAEYNTGWNLRILDPLTAYTNQGNSYVGHFSSVPGATDRDEDPKFIDSSRRLVTWDRAMGGPGTYQSGKARLMGVADGSVRVADLLRWVRRGFSPRNLNMAIDATTHIGVERPTPAFGTVNTGN